MDRKYYYISSDNDRKSLSCQCVLTPAVQNSTQKFGAISNAFHASAEIVLDIPRCECRGCSTHPSNPCRRIAGELYRGRHPIALHHFEGQTLCHLCLGRRLELRLQRLYPDVIPLDAR